MRTLHQPRSVTAAETAAGIVVVYRWFAWRHLLVALGGFVLAALARRLPVAGDVVAVGLVAMASYVGLVGLLNRTTLHATRETVRATHGPLPVIGGDAMDAFGFWPDVTNTVVPTARLLQIAKGARETVYTRDDEARSKVYLRAVLHDGAGAVEVQLLPSTAPPDVEDYVGALLDRWLQGADLPVYRGADLSDPDS